MHTVIIGAGIVGAMAAWRLSEADLPVTVLEQFDLGHDRGSSYGDSRVVRRVYSDPFYTSLMADAYPLWEELQSRYPDRELFAQTGGIFFGPGEHPSIKAAATALEESGIEYQCFDAQECRRRFPAFHLRDDEIALYEPGMGYARASRCVRAAAEFAEDLGAEFRFLTPVEAVAQRGGKIEVATGRGETVIADRLLICAGPWTQPLLSSIGVHIPLAVTRQTYVHLQPARHHENFEANRFPVWIDADSLAYGFPRLGDLPGVKIAFHERGETSTPETVARELHDCDRNRLRAYATQRFPDLSDEILYEKVCLYTNTPDENFVIDRVPDLPGAFVIGGLSGHGFKFGPLLGKIGAMLATGEELPYDLSRFSLARFETAALVS